MPSFDEINYSLRVNKNVERKLLVEVFASLKPEFPIESYQYLGFGSVWYVDFILMHRRLGIQDLVSVEKETSRLDRAEFNRPFACVKVLGGDLSGHLATMTFAKPVIAWLDYDDGIAGPMLKDITDLVQKAPPNSIVAVTCNAERRQLDAVPDGVASKDDPEKVRQEAVLRYYAKDLIPTPLKPKTLTAPGFTKFLGEALLAQISHAVLKAGREEAVVPLFNFGYSDGARMVTVGALLASPDRSAAVAAKKAAAKHEFFFNADQFTIEVPHLTRKEKLAFDQHLPSTKALDVKKLKFTIPDRLIRAYEQLYNYYPVFEELF
jgi:hypothetical protein